MNWLQKPTKCFRKPTETQPSTHKIVCKWCGRFREGRESLDDESYPSTYRNYGNIVAVKSIVRSNRLLTILEISEGTNLSFGAI